MECMKIQVLGSGCQTCKKLYEITQKAVEEMKSLDKVEYLTGDKGIQQIIELGSMSSPILAVNNRIAMVGFTPDIEKIKSAILEASK
jgi:hypothetical protein